MGPSATTLDTAHPRWLIMAAPVLRAIAIAIAQRRWLAR
jgi:hypothetical protein